MKTRRRQLVLNRDTLRCLDAAALRGAKVVAAGTLTQEGGCGTEPVRGGGTSTLECTT